jgi:hypothetical protein
VVEFGRRLLGVCGRLANLQNNASFVVGGVAIWNREAQVEDTFAVLVKETALRTVVRRWLAQLNLHVFQVTDAVSHRVEGARTWRRQRHIVGEWRIIAPWADTDAFQIGLGRDQITDDDAHVVKMMKELCGPRHSATPAAFFRIGARMSLWRRPDKILAHALVHRPRDVVKKAMRPDIRDLDSQSRRAPL